LPESVKIYKEDAHMQDPVLITGRCLRHHHTSPTSSV